MHKWQFEAHMRQMNIKNWALSKNVLDNNRKTTIKKSLHDRDRTPIWHVTKWALKNCGKFHPYDIRWYWELVNFFVSECWTVINLDICCSQRFGADTQKVLPKLNYIPKISKINRNQHIHRFRERKKTYANTYE